MAQAICLGCRFLQFNESFGRWECTRPGWKRVIQNPGIPQDCPFYKRRREGEKIRILPVQR
jgi:hypothetical protein